MPNINFQGFSDYHQRKLCSVTFNNEFDKRNFESNFNIYFRNHQVQAEPDLLNRLTVNVVYISELNDEVIKELIDKLL